MGLQMEYGAAVNKGAQHGVRFVVRTVICDGGGNEERCGSNGVGALDREMWRIVVGVGRATCNAKMDSGRVCGCIRAASASSLMAGAPTEAIKVIGDKVRKLSVMFAMRDALSMSGMSLPFIDRVYGVDVGSWCGFAHFGYTKPTADCRG